MAEPTGFEPATSDVTGRRSNQLNYDSACQFKSKKVKGNWELCLFPFASFLSSPWWAVLGSNQWPPVCKSPTVKQSQTTTNEYRQDCKRIARKLSLNVNACSP